MKKLEDKLMIFMVQNADADPIHTASIFETYMDTTMHEVLALCGPDAQQDTPKKKVTENEDMQEEEEDEEEEQEEKPRSKKKQKKSTLSTGKTKLKRKANAVSPVPIGMPSELSDTHQDEPEHAPPTLQGDKLKKKPKDYMLASAPRISEDAWETAMLAVTGDDILTVLAHAMYAETAISSVNYDMQLEIVSTWTDHPAQPTEPCDWMGQKLWGLQTNMTQLDSAGLYEAFKARGLESCDHTKKFFRGLKQTLEMQVLTVGGRVLLRTSDANFATEQQDNLEDLIATASVRPHECIVLDSATLPWEDGAIHMTTYLHNRVINLLANGGHAHIAITPRTMYTSVLQMHKLLQSLHIIQGEMEDRKIYFDQYMIYEPHHLQPLYISPNNAIYGDNRTIMMDCEDSILMLRIEIRGRDAVGNDNGLMQMCVKGNHSTTAAMQAMKSRNGSFYDEMTSCARKTAPRQMRQHGLLDKEQPLDDEFAGLSIAGWNMVWDTVLDTASLAVARDYNEDADHKPFLHTESSIYVPQCSIENAFAAMCAAQDTKLLFIELATDKTEVLTSIEAILTSITNEYITTFEENTSQVFHRKSPRILCSIFGGHNKTTKNTTANFAGVCREHNKTTKILQRISLEYFTNTTHPTKILQRISLEYFVIYEQF